MSGSSRSDFNEWLLIAILLALLVFAGGILWMVLSNVFGPVYMWLRIVETGGLWLLTRWGEYFWTVPARQHYEFWSLFKSSIPFGVASAVFVALIGFVAYEKVKSSHIKNHVSHKSPPDYEMIMRKMAALYPHNSFYLRFRLSDYPQEQGAAAMPMTAQQFIRSVDAVRRGEGGTYHYQVDKIREALIGKFGARNPFLNLIRYDEGRYYRAGRDEDMERAVDNLPWQQVVILYPALVRSAAMALRELREERAFLSAVKRSDEYMRDVWRDILKVVDNAKGGEVVLDDLSRADLSSPKERIVLAELMADAGDKMRSVVAARRAMKLMLSEKPDEEAIAAHNKVVATCRLTDQFKSEAYKTLGGHGFAFGIIARALEETRRAGIFPPNTFGWLRYIDPALWRFLVYIGMRTPCAEAAGMFEHYCAEKRTGLPLQEPFVEDAPEAIIRESRKFIFDIGGSSTDAGPILPTRDQVNAAT